MAQSALRFGFGVVFLLALLAPVSSVGQEQYYKKPETVEEYWKYMNHEIELGNFKLAASYLKSFIGLNPSDEDLLKIYDRDGSSAFQRLLTIPALRDEAKPLLQRVDAVVQKFLSDRKRLDALIKELSGGPEERAYAIGQLQRSGAYAVPALVDALIRTERDVDEHTSILTALPRLDRSTIPALLAVLDSDETQLKLEVIGVLRARAAVEAVPFLWYLSASPRQSEGVRKTATAALAYFLGVRPSELPPAKVALTRRADEYYQHKVQFPDPSKVTVWRWDGKQLVSHVLTASQAEEYYGTYFARQALDLDRTYIPAQVVQLSLALDRKAPAAKALARSVNPELVITVLEAALEQKRLPVILGAIETLGELGDARAARPVGRGQPVLIKALSYPDRRVQLAAADALLRIPAAPAALIGTQVVDILRRAVIPDTQPKALLGDANPDRANSLAAVIKQAGFEPVIVGSGRALLRRLAEAADIDVVLVEADLPDPPLTDLLAVRRADVNARGLPLFVLASASQLNRAERLARTYPNVWAVPEAIEGRDLKKQLTEALGPPISDAERKDSAAKAIEWLARIARGEAQGYDLRPAEGAILKALRSKELAVFAVEAAGRLPGRAAQRELADLVLEKQQPAALRSAAASALARNIEQFGLVLAAPQVKNLVASFEETTEPRLKENLALIIGSMQKGSGESGARLERYAPSLPAPKAAAPAKAGGANPDMP
jgi:hypothetical protein